MALPPAHEVVALAVYEAAGDEWVTMGLVHETIAELTTHRAGFSCGSCLWAPQADPAKTYWAARTWQRQGRRQRRLANR